MLICFIKPLPGLVVYVLLAMGFTHGYALNPERVGSI
jgi:hypothetical protein